MLVPGASGDIPSHFLFPSQKIASIFTPPNKVKIPSQISSLSHLSISSSLCPAKTFFKSITSANPLQNPLTLNPLRLSERHQMLPPSAALPLFGSEMTSGYMTMSALLSAHNDSMYVLSIYCFDPRDYGKSSSGFD
ncbi:unnamed protein product [Fraxinus pennsylvanica]|uniref:Uncharacterized protein n=1 Tax=Fraxinus pennsylvanica TaxID=56036 RepID=A0AAD1YR91_9LAMI|nr:unnamed protein product [Fraxinus pennsylvanica]